MKNAVLAVSMIMLRVAWAVDYQNQQTQTITGVNGQSISVSVSNSPSTSQSGSYTVTPGTGTFPISGNVGITGTPPVSVSNVPQVSQAGSFTVTPGTGTYPVSGAFFQSIQPVSQSGGWQSSQSNSYTVTPGTGSWSVSGANAGSYTVTPGTGTFPVSGVFWQVNQPVTDTIGSQTGGALSVTSTSTILGPQTGGALNITSTSTVLAAGTSNIGTAAVYGVVGSTLPTSIGNVGQNPAQMSDENGNPAVPTYNTIERAKLDEQISLLREISYRLFQLIELAGKGSGRAESTEGKEPK